MTFFQSLIAFLSEICCIEAWSSDFFVAHMHNCLDVAMWGILIHHVAL